jgi:hypothetical protein
MKKLLVWAGIFLGLAAFALVDIYVLMRIFGEKPSEAARPAQVAGMDMEDLLNPGELSPSGGASEGKEPPELDPTAIRPGMPRPKWLKLPPITPVVLTNGLLKVYVTRPDDPGAYHDARFDWSGMVARVEYNGHWFFNGPNASLDNKTNYPVFGTAEEFGMDRPLGFQEAKAGETFVKIGVGELLKPPSPPWYFWGLAYTVGRPGTWAVTEGPGWIQYDQTVHGPRGLAYAYSKRIELVKDQPVIRISRRLTNLGGTKITTTHYTHNFITLDGLTVAGPPCRMELRFQPTPHRNLKLWRTRGIVEPDGNALAFVQPLVGAVYLVLSSEPREAGDHWFRVHNPEIGAGVTVQGDRPLCRIAFYTQGPAICPEPFVQLNVEPSASESWETTYTFEADRGKAPVTIPAFGADKTESPLDWKQKLLNAGPLGEASTRTATAPATAPAP